MFFRSEWSVVRSAPEHRPHSESPANALYRAIGHNLPALTVKPNYLGGGRVSAPRCRLVEWGHDRVLRMTRHTDLVPSLPQAGEPTSQRREAPPVYATRPGSGGWGRRKISSAPRSDPNLRIWGKERGRREMAGLPLIHGHQSYPCHRRSPSSNPALSPIFVAMRSPQPSSYVEKLLKWEDHCRSHLVLCLEEIPLNQKEGVRTVKWRVFDFFLEAEFPFFLIPHPGCWKSQTKLTKSTNKINTKPIYRSLTKNVKIGGQARIFLHALRFVSRLCPGNCVIVSNHSANALVRKCMTVLQPILAITIFGFHWVPSL